MEVEAGTVGAEAGVAAASQGKEHAEPSGEQDAHRVGEEPPRAKE